jgi:hypothetical protein
VQGLDPLLVRQLERRRHALGPQLGKAQPEQPQERQKLWDTFDHVWLPVVGGRWPVAVVE